MKFFSTQKTNQIHSLENVFDQIYPRLYRYFRLRGATVEEAKDLASTTFEKALLHFSRYDPAQGEIQTWLFAIAHNLSINHWKMETAHLSDPIEDDIPDLESGELEMVFIGQEKKEAVLQALQTLDPRARQIIALKFGGPLTNRQISHLLGVSEQNVAVILYRSLLKLRKILTENEVHP
ncbi:MAG: RNA polymerase sigma factor [Anaerolineales bacterium]